MQNLFNFMPQAEFTWQELYNIKGTELIKIIGTRFKVENVFS